MPPLLCLLLCLLLLSLVTSDVPGFTDENGYACSEWDYEYYDCGTASSEHGYTAAGQTALLENCPTSCGVAPHVTPAPTPTPGGTPPAPSVIPTPSPATSPAPTAPAPPAISCSAGLTPVQDLTTNPCTCIASGSYTARPGCASHTGDGDAAFCHTPLLCETSNEAIAFPLTAWRPCDPSVDNIVVYVCVPCEKGHYLYTSEASSSCVPCPINTYNPSTGSTSLNSCLECPADLPSAAEGSASLESCAPPPTCFVAKLKDEGNDGWSGNELIITNYFTSEVAFAIGAQFVGGESRTEGPFCVPGCGCWTAQAGGGTYTSEVSWSLERDEEVVAEGTAGAEASFCFACSTPCGVGEQPTLSDDGCMLCQADSYSETEGGELCEACGANMVTSGEASVSANDCGCEAGYYMSNGECLACETNTYNPSVGATSASQCLACAEGENSWKGSASCQVRRPARKQIGSLARSLPIPLPPPLPIYWPRSPLC